MIVQISLKNYAIIDSLTVEFSDGLNIITGETGTGKSIIIDAINILLGDKVSSDIVKTGTTQTTVEALFDITNNKELLDKLEDRGYSTSDEQLVIKRIIPLTGKGKIFINGSIATLSTLSDITTGLIDIFGQHEHQSLIKPGGHIKFLDSYSNNLSLLEEHKNSYSRYLCISKKLEQALIAAKDRTEREEFLKYQLKELDDAGLRADEEENLRQEEKILSNAEKIVDTLNRVYADIYESGSSSYNTIKNLSKEVDKIREIDPDLTGLGEAVASVTVEIEDISFSLMDYLSKVQSDPERLEEINYRISEINGLKRKYGSTVTEILTKHETISQELSELTKLDDTVDKLKQDGKRSLDELNSSAERLSLKRKESSRKLMRSFTKEAKDVGLKGSMLDIKIESKPVSIDGIDNVSFLFTANPGEKPKPLSKVASGGELSRIMLLLKNMLSDKETGAILIFDEADSGIGGITAEIIGKKIRGLSENNQVICITHLPQVAKFAQSHIRVSKFIEGSSTNVQIDKLSNKERVEEMSRMLAGKNVTAKTLEVAKEMLSEPS